MKIEEIIPRIKKNKSLNKADKKELIEFWQSYKCPIDGDRVLQANYYDGEVKRYTVEELDYWYDETPYFIENFFDAMAKGEERKTRFAIYKPVRFQIWDTVEKSFVGNAWTTRQAAEEQKEAILLDGNYPDRPHTVYEILPVS